MTAPVYIIHGTDSWLRQQHWQKIQADWFKIHPSSQTEILSDTPDFQQLTQLLGTVSFFTPQRLIAIKNAAAILDWTPAQLAAITSLQQQLDDQTCVVYSNDKSLGVSKTAKLVLKWGKVLECAPLTEWQQPQAQRELQGWAKAEGKQLQPQAAQLLVEWIGPHRQSLATELSKAIAYAGSKPQISTQDIAAVSSPSHLAPFAMTDALLRGDRKHFFMSLDTRLEHDHPLPILSLLAGQFRTMIALWDQPSTSMAELAKTLGKSEFVLKKAQAGLRYWPQDRCKKALGHLHQLDINLKTGCNFPEALTINMMAKVWG